METLWQDLRYGTRSLFTKPGFAAVAVLTLALGIGATSTIFSFVNGILLRPFPYQEPDRLVLLDETAAKRGITGMGVSFPNFLDWREQNQVFTGIAAYDYGNFTLTGGGEPEQIQGGEISYNAFEVLGVSPVAGRTFRAEEDRPQHDTVVILGHGLWQRRFGADPSVIGQTIILNNRSRTVVGVMPPDFRFPDTADLWVPLALDTKLYTRTDHGLAAIARLKPGVTFEQAQSDLAAVARRIEEQNPVTNEGLGVELIRLRDGLAGDYRQSLLLMLGVVGLVLLIACANVANLLLARASSRQREIAVRAALGAGRWRILRQLLTESLLLGVLGGAFGLVVAWWGLDLLLKAIPIEFPFWMRFNLDGRVIGFTVGMSLLTGIIFGTAPAMQASKVDLHETLKEGGRGGVSARRHRLRGLLVVAEIALSLILLIGAGLMMRSFLRLQHVNPGFNPENVLTLRVGLPVAKYDKGEARDAFFRQLLERVRALPGVQDVGAAFRLPLSNGNWGRSLTVEGYPVLSVGQAPIINHCVVTPNYFHTMGIPLLQGRDFSDSDTAGAPKVTIIDERLAREYWPNESPVGKRIRFGPPEDNEPWHTIVGVVGEVKHESLDVTRRKSVYLPHAEVAIGRLAIVARADANLAKPESLVAAIRSQVKQMDPDLPVTEVRMMEEVVARSVWQPRLYSMLFAIFALVALALASVGIYGVMAYSVAQRTHEIGIRVALGAQKRDVMRMVIGQGMKLATMGVGAGVIGALALTRLMKALLFQVSATDPTTFITLVVVLTFVALVACYLPARRAARVDPMVALRYE